MMGSCYSYYFYVCNHFEYVLHWYLYIHQRYLKLSVLVPIRQMFNERPFLLILTQLHVTDLDWCPVDSLLYDTPLCIPNKCDQWYGVLHKLGWVF